MRLFPSLISFICFLSLLSAASIGYANPGPLPASTADYSSNYSSFNSNILAAVSPKISDSVLNVMKFGAKGDGIQNDAPALQSAIDEAARSLTPLVIPAGRYYIPSGFTLKIPSRVTIEGVGKDKSLLVTDSALNHAFPTLISIQGDKVVLRGLGISGGRPIAADQKSKASSGRYSLINISFDGKASTDITIENCLLSDAHGRALLFKGNNITIKDCDFLRVGRYSVDFKAVDGAISNFGRNECFDIKIIHNTFRYVGSHAVSAYRINRLTIEDNYLSQISGIGLANHQCQNIRLTENRIEYTGDNGIDVQRSQQTLITSNYFYCAGNKNAGDAGSAAAIFYGDDYATGTANKAIISNNFIRGEFSFNKDTVASRSQSCGIYIIDAYHLKVLHNTVNGIGDNADRKKVLGIEDGNGIMVVNSAKGKSEDIILDGNSVFDTKNHGILVTGQGRDIKVINNDVRSAGNQGIFMSAVGTNLFGSIINNTVTDGRNWFGNKIAADIYVEATNGWITHLNISDNQLRNNKRSTYKTRNDTVYTTHGIYFAGNGFAMLNNLLVADNQITGHRIDEIGFGSKVASYMVEMNRGYPSTGFRNNTSGTAEDLPWDIIPGYNQVAKPWIITETKLPRIPDYGNYSKGSVIHNFTNPPERWVAMNSGFAAQDKWQSNKLVEKGQTVFIGSKVYRCVKAGRTGRALFSSIKKNVQDGTVVWEAMGDRVIFKTFNG